MWHGVRWRMFSPRLQYPQFLLHVVPTAVQPPTPTTLTPSSLARTIVFGYKLNRGYHITVNITALSFRSKLYCHVTGLKDWLIIEVKMCTALWQPDWLTAAHSGFGYVLILFYDHYYATIWNNSQVTEIVFSLFLFQYTTCTVHNFICYYNQQMHNYNNIYHNSLYVAV